MAGQGENPLINAVISFQQLHVGTCTQPLEHPLLFTRGWRRSEDKATEVGELRLRSELTKNKIFNRKGG